MSDTSDPIRELVKSALSERGLNMSVVSKGLGRNHAYLHQFLYRGIPSRLPETIREKLAAILHVSEAQLKPGGPVQSHRASSAHLARPSTIASLDKIPVFRAEQGSDGWFSWTGEVVDHVSRSPQLAGASQAYALYVTGAGMEPRYYEGELLYVHPGKPVTNGAFVLVQVRPEREGEAPRASMKRLVKRVGHKVTFEQFNTTKQIEIKASDVLSIHRIVGSAESGGL